MSLGFKRVMSSIMAFVMMVSTLVMVNVASVSAAEGDFFFKAEDFFVGVADGTKVDKPVLSDAVNAAGIKVDDKSFTLNPAGTRAEDQKDTYVDNTGKGFTKEALAGGTRAITFTPASNGTVNVYAYVSSNNIKNKITIDGQEKSFTDAGTVTVFSAPCTANKEFKVSLVTNMAFMGIEYVSSSITYSWTLNTDGLVNVPKENVSIDTSATGATNTLVYNGTDYVVKEAALAEGSTGVSKDGNAFTVTVTDDMFLPVRENINISIANAGGKTLTFVGQNYGYTPNVTLDDRGNGTISLVQDTYTISIEDGTLQDSAGSAFSTVAIGAETAAISATYVADEIVTFEKKINISDLATETTVFSKGTTPLLADNLLKILTPSATATGNDMQIDSHERDITLADGTETFRSSMRLNTRGTGSTESRAVSFKTGDSAGKVYVYALAGNSNETRTLELSDGTNVQGTKGNLPAAASGVPTEEVIFNVEANTTYYLYGSDGGVYIYYIATVGTPLAAFDEVSSDTTTTTETTTETTTVTTTEETTTEEPTEGTTEAPVEGAQTHNFSVNGTESLFYTITGTVTDLEEAITINNVTYTKAYDINSNSDTISFTTGENGGTITIVCDNGVKLRFNGVSTTDPSIEDQVNVDEATNNVITATLEPNMTYTINRRNGTYIYYMEYVEGTSEGSSETTTEGTTEEQPENNVNISVDMTGNTGNVKVSINGTSYTFAANETKTISVAEGEKVKFEFDNDVARYITGWTGIDPDSYDSGTQAYFTTTDAAAEGVSIRLTYDPNAPTSSINEGFMTVTPDTENVLQYGNYGYGQTKGTGIGAVKAEGVAQLNSVSGVVTLYDYMGGYGSTDERLILNDDASVTFKSEGPGYLVLDCSLGTPHVTIGGVEATPTAIGTTGKQGYTISAADMEVVITKPSDASRSLQLKSVRYQTDGNVITVIEAGDADYNTVVNSLPEDMKADFGTVPEGKVFAKVVAELDQATADASTVDAIGVLVIDKATADTAISTSNAFRPTDYIDNSDENDNIIDLRESEALYDGIYDETAAVDAEGEYTLDSATLYSDGIYYMLRYVAVAQGDYYVLPYTVVSGNAAFDEGQFTNTNDLTKYTVTFDGSAQ